MPIYQALILGLVQGLSEFLPISSSAHLALAPWLFGWRDPGLAFDVALHTGTLVAVLAYFRRDWVTLGASLLRAVRNRGARSVDEWRSVFLILGTLPVAITGLVFQDLAESGFRSPLLIAATLAVMGVALWLADRFAVKGRAIDNMRWSDAAWIGVAQAFAIVPGVSRSGATITGARLLGFNRRDAAVFSFLLSMPAIAGAAILEAPAAVRGGADAAPLVIGVLAAGVSGWIAIDVLLRLVARFSYGVFAAYRVLLAAAILLVLALRG